MNKPLVSLLVRSMDRPTLFRALDSAANQTWPNIEIVVAAACGQRHQPLEDNYRGRALRFVVPDPNRCLPRPDAANACLDAATGEWLNFLDDDDELLPEHVESLLTAPRRADIRLLYSSARVHDAQGNLVGYSGRDGFHMQLYNQNRSQPVATIFHRSLIDEGARFDPTFPIYEDQDFFINCASRTEFQWVKTATCIWNGYIGDSGCGLGANVESAEQHDRYYAKLRSKWAPVFERWKKLPQSLIYLGQQHLKGGDLKIALGCLEQALSEMPGDLNALNLCGMANYHNADFARAIELLSVAERLAPGQPAIVENLRLARAALAGSAPASTRSG